MGIEGNKEKTLRGEGGHLSSTSTADISPASEGESRGDPEGRIALEAPNSGVIQRPTPDEAEALLVDHSVSIQHSSIRLWPIAFGSVAIILVIVGGISAYVERTKLAAEIRNLSSQLSFSRKKVEDLTLENAHLAKALADAEEPDDNNHLDIGSSLGVDPSRTSKEPTSAPIAADVSYAPATINTSAETTAMRVSSAKKQLESDPIAEPPEGWYVTVGAFSSRDNVERLIRGLKKDGFAVAVQPIIRNDKELQQIKVSGFSNRAAATEAALEIEKDYNTGRLTIGVVDKNRQSAASNDSIGEEGSKSFAGPSGDVGSTASIPLLEQEIVTTHKPRLSASSRGWFLYVDTYSDSGSAKDVAREIEQSGYNAKIAVEYRKGNLFYRVQVVGIESREEGEEAIEALANLGNMPRVQLRQY